PPRGAVFGSDGGVSPTGPPVELRSQRRHQTTNLSVVLDCPAWPDGPEARPAHRRTHQGPPAEEGGVGEHQGSSPRRGAPPAYQEGSPVVEDGRDLIQQWVWVASADRGESDHLSASAVSS